MIENTNPKNKWFKLNKNNRTILFIYLSILLICSSFYSGYLLFNKSELISCFNIEKIAIISCTTFSLLGSSIFYIRKLYKACINLDIVEPNDSSDFIRQVGVFLYYFLRPIFSISLGFILYLSFKIGVSAMTKTPVLDEGFIYSCAFFSFFIGYSSGDVIDKLEKVGKNIAEKSFNTNID